MRILLTGVLALAAGTAGAQEDGAVDLTGVWTLASPPMTRTNTYNDLPFTDAARERVEEFRALVDPRGETPGMFCVGAGMPEMMMLSGGYPMEIIQKDDQITLISENLSDIRRIFQGDRIEADENLFPARNGYSKGRWEGGALVVETTHLAEQLDSRYPHSEAARIEERFTLGETAEGETRLVVETVFTDPEWLTAPVEYRQEYRPYEVGWIMPYECTAEVWLEHVDALARGEAPPPAAE